MPFPPAHLLIGAGTAELARADGALPRGRAWAVGAVFALLPDADIAYRILTGEYAPLERSFTHSLLAAAAVWLAVRLVAGGRWAALAALAYTSHLAADLLQRQARTSVALLWPLQQRGMEPLAPLFPFVPIERGQGVTGAALSLLASPARERLLLETMIGAAVFAALLALALLVRGLLWLSRRVRGR